MLPLQLLQLTTYSVRYKLMNTYIWDGVNVINKVLLTFRYQLLFHDQCKITGARPDVFCVVREV